MIGEEVSTMKGEAVSSMGGNYSDPMVHPGHWAISGNISIYNLLKN